MADFFHIEDICGITGNVFLPQVAVFRELLFQLSQTYMLSITLLKRISSGIGFFNPFSENKKSIIKAFLVVLGLLSLKRFL